MSKSGHTYPVAQKTNRLTLVVPEVKREYMENGVRYYETEGGRIFDANIYDSKLRPEKLEVLPKFIPVGGSRKAGLSLKLIAANKRAERPVVIEKVCKKCDDKKPGKEFHKASNSKDGLRNICKDCANEISRAISKRRYDAERI